MARQFIREVKPYAALYRDTKNGLAWIEDGSTGMGISIHPNIDRTGSVFGMKKLGYWGKDDKVIQSHGFKYNISHLILGDSEMENILLNECECQECLKRRLANK